MINKIHQPNNIELLRRSLYTIRRLKERLNEEQATSSEPIAVIGMACRFPGGCTTPEKYWEFLKASGDGAIDVPPDRWNIDEFYDPKPGTFGKMYLRQLNFLQQDVGEFDTKFFRISPAEAIEMDPQQRLLLEVSWEALENVGQDIEKLKGSLTGVFIGISGSEYSMLPRDTTKINQYAGTGTLSSVASGRISFVFGFNGPALSVDTACSSSLVSTINAVEALHRRECDMVLAGGVNLMLSPYAVTSLCSMGALAKDGRCKPFDANGDGYSRAEGCGIIVLKRFSDAKRDGDNILALIQGGLVNNDGASSGLTVPNGAAQRELLKSVLSKCALKPDDVSYLEAHGTGTSLGDPIEMKAVTEVYGQSRLKDNPLIIGTVKGNIGHLEGAAGIASIMKVILCLQHKEIPKIVNYSMPNPKIQFDKIPAIVPLKHIKWKSCNGKGRIAGISSFGFSGTNAHIILSEAPVLETTQEKIDRSLSILTISAKSEIALNNLIKQYTEYFEQNSDLNIGDVCYTTNVGRTKFAYRAAFVSDNLGHLCLELKQFLAGKKKDDSIYTGKIDENKHPKIVFLFSGNIDDFSNDTKDLYDSLPFYKTTMDMCDNLFKQHFGISIINQLYLQSNGKKNQTEIKDACLFSIEYSLMKLFEFWGVKPAIVYGERVGEYVAAVSAGVLDLESAIKHIGELSYLTAKRKDIKSIRVFCKKQLIEKILKNYNGKVQISANYGNLDFVITGATENINNAILQFKGNKIELTEDIKSEWPSLYYEEYLAEFGSKLANEKYMTPKVRFISSNSGELIKKAEIETISYWQKQIVLPINFEKATASLHEQGYRLFLEIGPSPYLIKKLIPFFADKKITYLSSIKSKNSLKDLIQSIAELYCLGVEINWQSFEQDYTHRKIVLPNYPFERKRYWIAPPQPVNKIESNTNVTMSKGIPYDFPKGKLINSPIKDKQYEFNLSLKVFPEIKDSNGILHIGYYLEMLANVVAESFGNTSYNLKEMEFLKALIIPDDIGKTIFLVLNFDDNNEIKFQFYSKDINQTNWDIHVKGLLQLIKEKVSTDEQKYAPTDIQANLTEKYSGLIFYKQMEERGMYFGFSVQWVEEIWFREGEVLAHFRKKIGEEKERKYQIKIHPGVFDACAQIFHAALSKNIPSDMKYMVNKFDNFVFNLAEDEDDLWCHVILYDNPGPNDTLAGKLHLFDGNGISIIKINNVWMKGISNKKIRSLKEAMESTDLYGGRDEKFYNNFNESSEDQQKVILTEYLRKVMAKEMDMPVEDLDVNEPIKNLGMDSLIAIRFKNTVEHGLCIELPMEELIERPTISQLSMALFRLLPGINLSNSSDIKEKNIILKDSKDVNNNLELWTPYRKICSNAKIRLFCFPYAQEGASLFSDWQQIVPSELEVCPVQLPGRENRIKEKAFYNVEELVNKMEEVFEDKLLDLPCAFYGHSAGALVAFRLANKLLRNSKAKPVHLFIGGYTSPIYPNRYLQMIINSLNAAGFEKIFDYDQCKNFSYDMKKRFMLSIPMPVPSEQEKYLEIVKTSNLEELFNVFLIRGLSYMKMVDNYRHKKDEKINLPITVFHGEDDGIVTNNEIKAWKEITSSKFNYYVLPGGHFFMNKDQSEKELLQLIVKELFV